ncbi:TetR/AcrR family transcriptional regulator [Quadrisphaera granulorum]|nr:TetR/AcrR family transcriptional regulator C-terminal domain-containing protein [Quadrisphaera granulorum]
MTKAQRLDRETILAAGLELARAGKSVTVREMGARLNADPTAIYRHFRNRDELVRRLLDRVMALVLDSMTSTVDDWEAYLHEFAERTVETFVAHPAIGLEAMRLNTEGEAELDSMEAILSAFRAAGLTGDDLVRAYSVYSGFVLAFASSAVHAEGGDPWVAPAPGLDAARYPEIAASREGLAKLTGATVRQLSIQTVIDAALARARNV